MLLVYYTRSEGKLSCFFEHIFGLNAKKLVTNNLILNNRYNYKAGKQHNKRANQEGQPEKAYIVLLAGTVIKKSRTGIPL